VSARELARVLAVVPARGGSKGIPGKNIRPLVGKPLIAHSITCAKRAASVSRVVVSTDSDEIAAVAVACGGDVPFRRPAELATDAAPMWGVLQHALTTMETLDGTSYDALVLLDPTNPMRTPADIDTMVERLGADPVCDGVVSVVEPDANPFWHSVIEREGYMTDLINGAGTFTRRQDVPRVFSINGAVYVWRRDFVLSATQWRTGRLKVHVMDETPFVPLDSERQFAGLEVLLANHVLTLPGSEAQ